MRPVKQQPRFKCDFCTKVGTEQAIEKHEIICWKNPNRFCKTCENKGYVITSQQGAGVTISENCWYCSKKEYFVNNYTKEFEITSKDFCIKRERPTSLMSWLSK